MIPANRMGRTKFLQLFVLLNFGIGKSKKHEKRITIMG
jgi:hypothetical protein